MFIYASRPRAATYFRSRPSKCFTLRAHTGPKRRGVKHNLVSKFASGCTEPHFPYPISWRPWGFGTTLAKARPGGVS